MQQNYIRSIRNLDIVKLQLRYAGHLISDYMIYQLFNFIRDEHERQKSVLKHI